MLQTLIQTPKKTEKFACFLRNNCTRPEHLLWQKLRKSKTGYKFRRQAPLGPYIVDFLCIQKMLIVEVDGGSHSEWKQIQHDLKRDNYLAQHGFTILRFTNGQVKNSIASVIFLIKTELSMPDYLEMDGVPS